jgi:hypothetical protein
MALDATAAPSACGANTKRLTRSQSQLDMISFNSEIIYGKAIGRKPGALKSLIHGLTLIWISHPPIKQQQI